jgi:hypothetical protein
MQTSFSSKCAALSQLALSAKLHPRLSEAALIFRQTERQFRSTNTWLKVLQSPVSPASLRLKAQFQNTNTCVAASDVNNDVVF